jgi:hypothetical protein
MPTPRDIVKLARDLSAQSEATVTQALQGFDVETKIAVRHQLSAQAEERRIQATMATDQYGPPGRMATDLSVYRPGLSEMDRLLIKLGTDLSGDQRLTERELDERLTDVGITDPTERIAIKSELIARKLIPQPRPTVQAVREMSAKADERPTGRVLKDPHTGRDLVLQGVSW